MKRGGTSWHNTNDNREIVASEDQINNFKIFWFKKKLLAAYITHGFPSAKYLVTILYSLKLIEFNIFIIILIIIIIIK